jgi:prepilin-type N-terminal cleavage/methylation domain-containing protein
MRHTNQSQGGFTLVELVISASISSMILVAAYLCLNASVASRKTIEPRAEVIQNARVALGMISADLRAACALSKDTVFLGTQRTIQEREYGNMDFGTHNYMPKRPREGDFCQASYFVDEGSTRGTISLWRRRNPAMAMNELDGGKREEIAQDLRAVTFEYFDGLEWYATWGESKTDKADKKPASKKNPDQPSQKPPSNDPSSSDQKKTPDDGGNLEGMPKAVRITLAFEPEPRKTLGPDAPLDSAPAASPLVFQTVVRLELADRIVAGTSADSSSFAQPGQPGGAPTQGGAQ